MLHQNQFYSESMKRCGFSLVSFLREQRFPVNERSAVLVKADQWRCQIQDAIIESKQSMVRAYTRLLKCHSMALATIENGSACRSSCASALTIVAIFPQQKGGHAYS